MTRLSTLVLLAALAFAPAHAREPVARPQDMAAHFKAHYEAGDLDGLVALFEDNAVLRIGDGATVQGRDAIRATLQGFLAPGAIIETLRADIVENDDLAFVSTQWRITGSLQMEGRAREVLRRQADGRWLYAIDLPEPDA